MKEKVVLIITRTYVYLQISSCRLLYEVEEEMFLVTEQVELYHLALK